MFFLKTDEAHIVKSTIEVLQNNFTDVCFEFGDDSINLVTVDNKNPWTKLAFLSWNKEQFNEYNCQKAQNVGVNLQHFYKLLKNIKKKDQLSFELVKNKPGKLMINKIFSTGQGTQSSESELQVQRRQLIHIKAFEGYGSPVLVSTGGFQRACKEINQLSKKIIITIKGNYMNLSCNVDGMYCHNVPFGEDTDTDDIESDDNVYEDEFDTKVLMGLVKVSSLNDKMKVFPPLVVGKPLKLSVNTGNLGELVFYIRSRSSLGE